MTARNAAWDGMFQVSEVTRVPETDIYTVYYSYVGNYVQSARQSIH